MFKFRLTIERNAYIQLIVISLLIMANFWVVNNFDVALSEIEKTVHEAEGNGTRSQKIAILASLVLAEQEDYKQELNNVVHDFENHINNLKNTLHTTKVSSEVIDLSFNPVVLLWNQYKKHAEIIVNIPLKDKGKIDPEVQASYTEIMKRRENLLRRNDTFVKDLLVYFDEQQAWRDKVFLAFFIINMVSIVVMGFFINYNVARPISQLNKIDEIIKQGNFDRRIEYNRKDELGILATSINTLFKNLQNAADFIIDIGEGKLDTEYERSTDEQHDRLGTALLEMRDKMRQVNEADRQRTWVSEGLAKFADIFQNQKDAENFTYIIISNLVKYIGANQGGLFIVEDEKDEDSHMELIAAFAFEKRKYIQKRIEKGEGLVGEVFQDGTMMYLTDVPNDYVNITSGLGEANPSCLLLVPLKLNDEVYGVIELASFKKFESFQIEFVEKLGESIASSFASVKNSKQTEKLLKESMQIGEQMKAQEEEMRQNLEELIATQEELTRKNQTIEHQKAE
jgi:HAMP domain-containing protein/putative methionine-R-sulfoxide reductase with GAF domain